MKNIRKKSIYFYKQSFRDLAQLIIKSVFKNDIFFFLCFANKFCYADLLSPIHTESESTVALNTIFLLRTNGRSPKKTYIISNSKIVPKNRKQKKMFVSFFGVRSVFSMLSVPRETEMAASRGGSYAGVLKGRDPSQMSGTGQYFITQH